MVGPTPSSTPCEPFVDWLASHRRWVIGGARLVVSAVVALGVALLPCLPAFELWGATMVNAQPQPGPQAAAIQATILKANQEQSDALATGNSSVMSDTATGAYYRQLVQINQSLTANGVTSIDLTNVTWGPINITGNTATATSYETWVTTYIDGTTTEATDTNLYTLVQQNGTWLIQDDQQTAGAPSPAPAPTGQPTPTPVPAGQTTSHNWSGYAATGGIFTGVTGTWTVPQPSSTITTGGVGATWVGIGGVTSRDLIQAGTQDVTAGGQHVFQTWIETLPAPSRQVPLAVAPGDSVRVSIVEQGSGSGIWQVSLTNNTSQQSFQTVVNYGSSESSAEWIEEAPSGRGGILPLDPFGSVVFSGDMAMENGEPVNLSQSGAQPITMLNANKQPLAVPSAITSDGSGFTVTRTSAPATTGTGGPSGRPSVGDPPGSGEGG